MPEDFLNADRLRKITDEMIITLTSAPYVEAMRTLKATPLDQRLKVGAELLTTSALRAKGVPMPDNMRVSSRYFEAGSPTLEVTDPEKPGDQPIARFIDDPTTQTMLLVGAHPMAGCCCGGAGACGGCGGGGIV